MAKYGDLEARPDDGQNEFSDIIKSRSVLCLREYYAKPVPLGGHLDEVSLQEREYHRHSYVLTFIPLCQLDFSLACHRRKQSSRGQPVVHEFRQRGTSRNLPGKKALVDARALRIARGLRNSC
ncbi:hypothetical protein NN561_006251 [Cricetulus griseus]